MKTPAKILAGILSALIALFSPGFGCWQALAGMEADAAAAHGAVDPIAAPLGGIAPVLDQTEKIGTEIDAEAAGRAGVNADMATLEQIDVQTNVISSPLAGEDKREVENFAPQVQARANKFANWLSGKKREIQAFKEALQNGNLNAGLILARKQFAESGESRGNSSLTIRGCGERRAVLLLAKTSASKTTGANRAVPQPMAAAGAKNGVGSLLGGLGAMVAAVLPAAAAVPNAQLMMEAQKYDPAYHPALTFLAWGVIASAYAAILMWAFGSGGSRSIDAMRNAQSGKVAQIWDPRARVNPSMAPSAAEGRKKAEKTAAAFNREELKRHFASRRDALAKSMPDSLILMSGGRLLTRNDDVEYVFRQKSDFLYLTGVEAPNHLLLIDSKTGRQILLVPRATNFEIVWGGAAAQAAQAKKIYGFKEVAYVDELPKILSELLKGRKEINADKDSAKLLRKAGFAKASGRRKLAKTTKALQKNLGALRLVKTPTEIKLLQIANDISSEAHIAAMRRTRPGQREFEVQANMEKVMRERGLKHLAYPSIVGAGRHPATLHYEDNSYPVDGRLGVPMKNGDFLLADVGGEFMGYAADITRTFPVGGRFTDKEKAVYSIVLAAQKSAISKARPGVMIADLTNDAGRIIAQGLKSLGILKGDISQYLKPRSIAEIRAPSVLSIFFPHGLSHMMGLDVHDILEPGQTLATTLKPGHVLTVEPGIYFNETVLNRPQVREKYKDLIDFDRAMEFLEVGGVRIEDDIVIRKKGPPLNLTKAPKEIADIEALRQAGGMKP